MGSWFSNIHIRKNDTFTLDDVKKSVCQLLKERGYLPIATEEDADGMVVIVSDDNSQWFSFFSELQKQPKAQALLKLHNKPLLTP